MDNQDHPATEADETTPAQLIKNILFAVGGLLLLFAIFGFMPMVFTYFSNGDLRP